MTKSRAVPLAVLMCASLCGSLAIEVFRTASARFHREHMAVLDEPETIPKPAAEGRSTVPYSVIPGGVYAPEELRSAIRRDAIVKLHYAGFDQAKIRFVKLQSDSYRYVSYRRANQIYWTKKQLLLPRGELLFTDGEHYARARCGNRLALYPPTDPRTPAQLAENNVPPPPIAEAQNGPDTAVNNDLMPAPNTIAGGSDLLPNLDGETIDTGTRSILDPKQAPVASFFIQSWPLVVLPTAAQSVPGGNSGGKPPASSSTPAVPDIPPTGLAVTPVPEASAVGLFCLGILGVWWAARRRSTGEGEDHHIR